MPEVAGQEIDVRTGRGADLWIRDYFWPGDQSGVCSSQPRVRVRFRCPLPSAFMTQMSDSTELGTGCLWNASFWPSGDQEGSAASLASSRAPPPSALMTQTSKVDALPHPLQRSYFCLPSRRSNAIFFPPGDQAGAKLRAPLRVSLRCPLPSAFMT